MYLNKSDCSSQIAMTFHFFLNSNRISAINFALLLSGLRDCVRHFENYSGRMRDLIRTNSGCQSRRCDAQLNILNAALNIVYYTYTRARAHARKKLEEKSSLS